LRRNDALLVLGIVCGVLFIYARHLDVAPPALLPDEAAAIRQAESIAQTGRDLDGRRFPLFFHLHDNVWTQPLPVYFMALMRPVVGSSEAAVRVPSVIVAALDVALIYLVAARLFGRGSLALLGAALLTLAPLHFIHGRLALGAVYPVAFILTWLLFLAEFVRYKDSSRLFAAALSLGAGFYAHQSSVLTMPAFLVLTLLTIRSLQGSLSQYGAALLGFAVPLVILVPWFYWHYDVFRFTLGDWGLHTLANPRDGLRYSLFSWPALGRRSMVYWGFFSPSYLFFTGGDDLAGSTRQAGIFLGLTAIPLLYGVYHIVTSRWSDPMWRVILVAFALAPVAAATFNDPKAAGRALGMLPLGVLIAVAGFEALVRPRVRMMQVAALLVLLLLPIQFYRFYADYFTQYPQRWNTAFGQGVARE
jgi:4-amino-4-deoxy-L-arabinose transferase-like glycosyltransferase